MIESQEAFTFTGEANPFTLVRLNEFFESKQMLGEVPIPDQINSLGLSFAEERFDDILASIRVSYDGPLWGGSSVLVACHTPYGEPRRCDHSLSLPQHVNVMRCGCIHLRTSDRLHDKTKQCT